jgi:iron complex outermembrane recepter protein
MVSALICAAAHTLMAQETPSVAPKVEEAEQAASGQPVPTPATASTPSEEEELVVLERYVVTGTLIRGIAPVGSNVISLNQERVAISGATNGSELLATVPQVGNMFNSDPSLIMSFGSAAQIQVLRPNLRNLPGGSLSTGAATLVLIDGHRVAGVGVTTSAIDPDTVPVGALENVEISTDGGSAVYGADAVGGVLNFVSRRRFDGAQFSAHYGVADKYYKTDANFTVGKDWGKGSAYISASFQNNNSIFGRDTSYSKRLDYSQNPPIPTGLNTDLPNVVSPQTFSFVTFTFTPGVNHAMPALIPNTYNRVDALKDAAVVPSAERRGVFFGLSQDLSEKVKVDFRAYYSKRDTNAIQGPANASVGVPSTNPFYIPLPAPVSPTATETVNFSFGPLLGYSTLYQTTHFDQWGANANVVIDLNDNWQLRTLLNYSDSNSTYWLNGLNPTLLNTYAAGTTPQTAINPYNIASTPNKQLITDLLNYETAGQSQDKLTNVRAVADGILATLPGGKVRLAFGYEFSQDDFKQRFGSGVIGNVNTLPYTPYTRRVNSGFGELALPLVGKDNAVSPIQSLVLSAAWRYDDYSDFGDTSNPKYGVTYKPVEWLALRGNWSKAFNAPTPVDQLGRWPTT